VKKHMEAFMELPPKTPLNSGHRFCGMELEHTKHFLGLSSYFTVTSRVMLLVAIVGVTSLLPHATKTFLKISFRRCQFHLWVPFSFC
jgi:hypothetical protein